MMKLKDGGMTILVCVVIAALSLAVAGSLLSPNKPDGPIEEAGEAVLYSATGIELDVTPDSKED